MRTLRTIRTQLLVSLVSLFMLVPLAAQQQPQPAQPNQPIELPEIIVQGRSRVDIPGGSKQAPARPPLLTAALLDSLNPIEKIPLPSLPEAPWPSYAQPFTSWPGWVSAGIGNYLTPMLAGGYSFETGGYLIDVMADLESSSGWTPNSEYTTFNVGALSTYVAPEKFLFFGGSTTIVDVGLGNRSYNLFARADAASRSSTGIHAGVQTEGSNDGLQYNGGIEWATTSMSTAGNSVSDNHLEGALELMQQWRTFDVGGRVDVRLRGFGGNSYPFTSLLARGAYQDETIMASATAGPQWATSTQAEDRFGFAVRGELDYFLSEMFTLEAHAGTGLRALDFRDLLKANPYVSDTMVIDVPYDIVAVGGSIYWHPSIKLSVSIGADLTRTDRDLVWVAADTGTFEPAYRSTTTFTMGGDVRWLISSRDALVADLSIISASVDDANTKTYTPSVLASAGYERQWTDRISSNATLVYVGERFADLDNTIPLSGYIDLRLGAGYEINKTLSVTLQTQNLLSSTMVLWDGYRERGIFISGGILWKF